MDRRLAVLLAAIFGLFACAAPAAQVSIERSDQIRTTSADDGPVVIDDGPVTTDDAPVTTDDASVTTDEQAPTSTLPLDPSAIDTDAIDFGDDKPERFYDDFLLAALTDIENWLAEEYPIAFGEAWNPLQGGVWAGYPERTDPIPGCGERETSYEDLQLFVAFYCPVGDFIVYDDGDEPIPLGGGQVLEPILFSLARDYGPATIGIVLAHEYGHAIQQRTGALDENLPTVTTEQQADCIAGAWAARAEAGLSPGISFGDSDVSAGLISMIEVQDPVGTDPLSPGGHGSGFDRVGAFQVGFRDGLVRCAELVDDPLPLIPLQFTRADMETGGNAPYGFEDVDCFPDTAGGCLFDFLVPDLNLLYDNDLDVAFPNFEQLELVPTQSLGEVSCDDPVGDYDNGVLLCLSSNTVFLNDPVARGLYADFGDFGPGYLLGIAWAEAAQLSTGTAPTGEERQLRSDCLTGNWVRTVIPETDEDGNLLIVTDPDGTTRLVLPEPRDPDRGASISPNDLTEAIQTVIVIGDEGSDDDLLGSAFEKIDAFRQGILNGLTACV